MSKKQNELIKMRKAAENQLADAPKPDYRSVEELLHELQVHQIELEMQNDELKRAQVTIEQMRDRYIDLYELAPVGYLTLTPKCRISEVNLTCAKMLGLERSKIINRSFSGFVSPEDSDKWHLYFKNVLLHNSQQNCELKLRHSDVSFSYARLDCLRVGTEGAHSVRVALTDITERKNLEQAIVVVAKDRRHSFESSEQLNRVNNRSHGANQLIDSLTNSEMEVFNLIVSGHSSQDIAGLLSRSIKTIETHRANIRVKLHLKDGAALIRYATQMHSEVH